MAKAGRPKGSRDKVTRVIKDAITEAAEMIAIRRGQKQDGRPWDVSEALCEWAMSSAENEKIFWKDIWTRIAPLQAVESGEVTISFPVIYEQRPDHIPDPADKYKLTQDEGADIIDVTPVDGEPDA